MKFQALASALLITISISATPVFAAEKTAASINPALLYHQGYLVAPQLSTEDRAYLFDREWRGQKLPDQFNKLMERYDAEFRLVREAATSTAACDWGIDMSKGPSTLLPHLSQNRGIAQVARIRAMWHTQNGRGADAIEDLLSALALGRNSARDGTMISSLIQISMEAIVYSGLAENFGKFTPPLLERFLQGLDAAPARLPIASCIPVEKALSVGWWQQKVAQLRADHPGRDEAVMAEIRALVIQLAAAGDSGTDAAGAKSWDRIQKASGGTSEGVLRLLAEMPPLYDEAQRILGLPRAEYEARMPEFHKGIVESPNPFVPLMFPAANNARTREFAIMVHEAMVRTAIAYKLHGEAVLASAIDPMGAGPFNHGRFAVQGIDRALKLKSSYTGRGFPEILLFVESDGVPFKVEGKEAGRLAEVPSPKAP